MNPTDLVTGATGFIGRALVKALTASGRRVRCLARPGSDISGLEGTETVRGDLLEPASLAAAVSGAERIWHLGALVRPEEAISRRGALRRKFFAVNGSGTAALAAAAAAAGARRFVYFSSISALGPGVNIADGAPPAPLTLYGKSKLLGEAALRKAAAGTAMDAIIIRPAMIFGPGAPGWADLMRKAAGAFAAVPGRACNTFSVCHIDDLVAAALLAAEKGAAGAAFNVSSLAVPLRDLLLEAASVQGRRPVLLPLRKSFLKAAASLLEGALAAAGLYAPGFLGADRSRVEEACACWSHSCEGIRSLGWEPAVPLRDGLASLKRAG